VTSARSVLRRVRETLDDHLSPARARAALFDAFREWGPEIPSTRGELIRFVRGPLRRVLDGRVGTRESLPILMEVENALAVVDSADDEPLSPHPSSRPPPPSSAADTTRALNPMQEAVRVVVVSSTPAFAGTLELSFGSHELDVSSVSDVETLRFAVRDRVHLLVVDGAEPLRVEPTRLAGDLDGLAADTWLTIWGADLPYGAELAHALEAGGVEHVPLRADEGIGPLVDLVRSRRA